MAADSPLHPNALDVYTVIVLSCEHAYLLLQRAPTKRAWPNLWTGVGGRVEANEHSDLQSAALRELAEETGIRGQDVAQFTLRRALLHARPQAPLTLLLYYTGSLRLQLLPACMEGKLAWVTANELPRLAVIGSTRPVLPLLLADAERDPCGKEAVRLGIASFAADGEVAQLAWLSAE